MVGGGGHGILPLSASSHEGAGGWQEKILHHQGSRINI